MYNTGAYYQKNKKKGLIAVAAGKATGMRET
jgi:hypothetical protein